MVNKLQIREYGRNKRHQTSKCTILVNGAYSIHYDWYKIQKVIHKGWVPLPMYGLDGCSFKLTMQMFIYNFLFNRKRGIEGYEFYFDVIWLTVQLVIDKHTIMDNPKYEIFEQVYIRCFEVLRSIDGNYRVITVISSWYSCFTSFVRELI